MMLKVQYSDLWMKYVPGKKIIMRDDLIKDSFEMLEDDDLMLGKVNIVDFIALSPKK